MTEVILGVNYHPSAAGCEWWTDFDEKAIRADFAAMADAGLNAVRLFLFWRDFMPTGTEVDAVVLDRLRTVVVAAGEAGLSCVLSLLTIWMNGQLLDPDWRHGRSLWRDPAMRFAERLYLTEVARSLRTLPNILAYDLGDELWHVDPVEAGSLTRAQVAEWYVDLASAIREESPEARIMQANDATAVFGAPAWRYDNQQGLDFVGVHGFPPWSPGMIESTLAYKATHLPAFLARTAATTGPAIVDELGSYGVNASTAASFLSAAAASVLVNGAAGIFVWCWQDIASAASPYRERPAERLVGLHDLDRVPKPAMAAYRRVIRRAGELAEPSAPARVGLYQTPPGSGTSYLDTAGDAGPGFHSYLLLKRAHLEFDLIGPDTLARPGLVICPAPLRLSVDDLTVLREWAEDGATVYLSLGDHVHALPGRELIGAEVVDYRIGDRGKSVVRWADREWPMRWAPGSRITTMVPTTGSPVGTYPDGSCAVVVNPVGAGRFVFTNAPVEAQFDEPGRLTATSWHTFYHQVAAEAGIAPAVRCAEPDLEIMRRPRSTVVVNHGERRIVTTMTVDGRRQPIALDAKDWMVLP